MSETLIKKTSLRICWTEEMEAMLLDLWEEKIEQLRGSRKNSHIFQEMASTMHEAGFNCSWNDIRTKLDNLTRKYKTEKCKIGPTGGTPSSWVHYNKVHSILGSFKQHNIEKYMHESTDTSTLTYESEILEIDLNASCCSYARSDFEVSAGPPPRKKRSIDANAELVKLAKELIELLKETQEERKQQVNEMVKRLDTISNQNADFQSKFGKFFETKKINSTLSQYEIYNDDWLLSYRQLENYNNQSSL